MDPRARLEAFIEQAGGVTAAASVLNTPLPTLANIRSGWRGVSRRMAARWDTATDGKLPANEMIWIAPTRKEKPRRAAA